MTYFVASILASLLAVQTAPLEKAKPKPIPEAEKTANVLSSEDALEKKDDLKPKANTEKPDPNIIVSGETAAERRAAKEADAKKVVCKREKVPGSNFRKKVCATKAQWARAREDSRNATQTMQRRGAIIGGDGN